MKFYITKETEKEIVGMIDYLKDISHEGQNGGKLFVLNMIMSNYTIINEPDQSPPSDYVMD